MCVCTYIVLYCFEYVLYTYVCLYVSYRIVLYCEWRSIRVLVRLGLDTLICWLQLDNNKYIVRVGWVGK